MTVKDIFLYPVKGLKGIRVDSAKLTNRGFEHDRRFMLVDESGYFLSQRTHPQLATYTTTLLSDGAVTVSKGDQKLDITFADVTDTVIEAGMFEHVFPVHVLANSVNQWWSAQLSQAVRMVAMTAADIRIKNYVGDGDSTELSMADGYPFLVVGTASLQLLNSKLDDPVPMERFRPSIVINTETPHVEDSWKHISIGTEQFYIVKPCARCQVITIDQQTGIKTKEPLRTLSTYQKVNNNVNFGANAVGNSEGFISVGDTVNT